MIKNNMENIPKPEKPEKEDILFYTLIPKS